MPDDIDEADRCDCGCRALPDYGACDNFESGETGRCVYCDHAETCHTDDNADTHTPPL